MNTVKATGRDASAGVVSQMPSRCRVPVIVYAAAPSGICPGAACAIAVSE